MSVAPDRPPRSVSFLVSQLGFVGSRGFAEALRPLGIDPREWSLLRYVAASEGQAQQTLAERLAIPASRIVALVDRLEEAGLIERRPDPTDRRVRALHVTAEGRRVLGRAIEAAIAFEKQFCAALEPAEREQLIDLLQKVQAGQVALRGVHPGLASDEPKG